MAQPLRVGVAGAGALGYHHIRWLRSIDGALCAGFYDADSVRAARVSDDLRVRAFGTLDELLDACDAVCVVVPTTSHASVGLAAVRRGKHLLVEKPLTTTIAEADELLSAAQAAGVVVQTGHIERFNRAIRAALPYIDNPRFITSERLAPFKQRGTEVAVVLDLMIHDIDLVLDMAGAEPEEIRAAGVRILSEKVDIANVRLAFASGCVANVTASRVSTERIRKMRLFQPNQYVSIDYSRQDGAVFTVGTAQQISFQTLNVTKQEPLKTQLDAFLDAVTTRTQPACDVHAGTRSLGVALEILAKIEEHAQLVFKTLGSL